MRSLSLVVVAMLLVTGCSILELGSELSGSVLESITSVSGSSSAPGGAAGEDRYLSYRRDVRLHTVACLEDGESGSEFLRGVSRIAGWHGISDWEDTEATGVAIGEAVRERPGDDDGVAQLREDLAGLDPALLAAAFGNTSQPD